MDEILGQNPSHRIPVANTVMTFMGFLKILSLPLHVQWLHPGFSRSPTNWYFNSLYSNCWSFPNPCTTPEIYHVKLSKNRISIKLWRNMKKQEWNHTQWTQRPWGCYVLSRALSRKLKAYSLRQEVKKIRVKNLNLEPQVEICKYIEQYIMLHDQHCSIIFAFR